MRELYYDIKSQAGFAGAPRLYKLAKETKPKAIPKEKKEAKGTNTEEVVSEESKPLIIEDVTEVTVVE